MLIPANPPAGAAGVADAAVPDPADSAGEAVDDRGILSDTRGDAAAEADVLVDAGGMAGASVGTGARAGDAAVDGVFGAGILLPGLDVLPFVGGTGLGVVVGGLT